VKSTRPFLKRKIDDTAALEKQFVVYAATADDDLAERFATRNVRVTHRLLPDVGDDGFVIVRDRDGFRAAIGIATLRELLTPPVRPLGESPEETTAFQRFLTLLDDTLFRSTNRRQLLATSREIEDLAWRRASGRLHAGFQSLTAFRDQLSVYQQLAAHSDLDVHVYGHPEWSPPDVDGLTVHAESNDEIGDVWFVTYDGDGDDDDKCALLAEQRESSLYDGFWTYDSATVDELVAYLERSYG